MAPDNEHSDHNKESGRTDSSSTASFSELSGTAPEGERKRLWRVRNLIRALSFDRGSPSPPPNMRSIPTYESALTIPSAVASMSDHDRKPQQVDNDQDEDHSSSVNSAVHIIPILHGIMDPEGETEIIFYDAAQNGDNASQKFHSRCQRESIVLSNVRRGGNNTSVVDNPLYVEVDSDASGSAGEEDYPYYHPASPPRPNEVSVPDTATTLSNGQQLPPKVLAPPAPPKQLPLRFLRAGKGDIKEGLRRYELSLAWRREFRVDNILREPNHNFDVIKQHYKHYCHGKGKNGEPCFYEQPPKTNLKALREAGVGLETVLRHYIQVTEFQWQFLERDDLQKSIYIIDLEGMRFGDFVGEVVDFVKRASKLSNLHYPERAGYVFVINVPSWFKVIWNVVKQWVDPVTLEKISILRGKEEIRQNMELRISADQLPPEYGGKSAPLGESKEEKTLRALIMHNNAIANGDYSCGGISAKCPFCSFVPARSY